MIARTNELGQYTTYAYDVAGRKTAETNANGEVILYTYNNAGDLIKLVDGKGQTTTWGYDQYGHVTSKTNQAGTEILRYAYDANGRLTNRWSLAKGNTRYVYDSAGNLTLIDYPSSLDITMQYDANNRLTNMTVCWNALRMRSIVAKPKSLRAHSKMGNHTWCFRIRPSCRCVLWDLARLLVLRCAGGGREAPYMLRTFFLSYVFPNWRRKKPGNRASAVVTSDVHRSL